MSNVIDELRVALSAARAKLNAIAAATGSDPKLIRNFGSSAPASPLVEKALFTGGYAAGLTATQIALAAGESRHYIACTWASWAWTVELPRIRARIGDDSSGEMFVNRVIDTITKRISEDWATEAGFSEREVRKSVGEEIGFFCRQGMIA